MNVREQIARMFWNLGPLREIAAVLQPTTAGLPRVRFRGVEYVIVGTLDEGGALATREQYETGEMSFAHLYSDGTINRFGEVIGDRAELELLP